SNQQLRLLIRKSNLSGVDHFLMIFSALPVNEHIPLSSLLDPPKLPSVSVSPSGQIVEGSSVTLTCSSDANPAAKYTWYKDNQTLHEGPEGNYHFTSISSEDRGIYYCKTENQYGQIKSTSLFVDIVEGSSVNLTCSSDANPAANYTWYKENEDSPKASGQIFTITDFRAEHSGNYYSVAVPAAVLALILIPVFIWIM
uniref:Ig-like domain-containing protein n=1 Tax=Lates calcarifer TaxID=8187 RepID=A0A4W6EEU3_LATCA